MLYVVVVITLIFIILLQIGPSTLLSTVPLIAGIRTAHDVLLIITVASKGVVTVSTTQ